MSNLKDLRSRRKSVQSTKKITAAMKLIAAAKLRHAQTQVLASRHYADALSGIMNNLLDLRGSLSVSNPLLIGRENVRVHLVIIATSDRGLCGGFNGTVVRNALRIIRESLEKGHAVKLITIGRKGFDQLKKAHGDKIIETYPAYAKPLYRDAALISKELIRLFESNVFDMCSIVYNKFISALSQKVVANQLIPLLVDSDEETLGSSAPRGGDSALEFEPSEEQVLEEIVPKNITVQLYSALLENAASEQGARMTAMDSATRNAEDMLKKLNLTYNRTRQAYITKELIEIISGADAL
jgi:F-type H+-transporting ATPase subunit gamma